MAMQRPACTGPMVIIHMRVATVPMAFIHMRVPTAITPIIAAISGVRLTLGRLRLAVALAVAEAVCLNEDWG
jgi:hypothetical protein